jgi:hypothetical protein
VLFIDNTRAEKRMLDNLKLAYVPDFMQLQASFDLPAGALDKLHDAVVRREVMRSHMLHLDYDVGSWLEAEVRIEGQWVFVHADKASGRAYVSMPAKVYGDERLDGTDWNAHDIDGQWPEFIAPLRAIKEILTN